MTDALVLPSVGQYGRVALHEDPIQQMIAHDRWETPAEGDEVESVDGKMCAWTRKQTNDDGWLRDHALRSGYVFWHVEVERDCTMMLDAAGHRMVFVNSAPRGGDVYAKGWTALPVQLREGKNEILFHVSRGRLRAKLTPPKSEAFFLTREATLPDLIVGEETPVLGGVVVVNASTQARNAHTIVTSLDARTQQRAEVPRIEPMTIRKIPFLINSAIDRDDESVTVTLRLLDDRGEMLDETTINLRVRGPHDKQQRTFISEIDGGVQYYAVTPRTPASVGSEDMVEADVAPGLILTLHGAGVQARGQANAYAPKDWAHIVAPTNRRPFGFDWEDWGRLDALEVLDLNMKRLNVDPVRVYLSGHSMGGHGTWNLGVLQPDRFAAIGPSAGWRSFDSYGGAASYDRSDPIGDIMMRAIGTSDTFAHIRNTLHYGVYILHGDQDNNVPVSQARFMREQLGTFHPDFAYYEQPGAGHWWGGRCVDWPPMMEFFRAHERTVDADLDRLEFHTANPGVSSACRWFIVEQQDEPLKMSSIIASIDREQAHLTIETKNITRFSLIANRIAIDGELSVDLDGQGSDSIDLNQRLVTFVRAGDGWSVTRESFPFEEKGPHRNGPFKDAFRHRVIFVYGTQGTAEENAWAREKARYDAETFWYRGNASPDVMPDTAFDPEADRGRSVILYGHREMNAAWMELLADSPVQVGRGWVRIGDEAMDGTGLGCLFLRPRPGSERASIGVVAGTGLPGMRWIDRIPYFVSGVGYPDFLVLDADASAPGLGRIRAAGYFDNRWRLDMETWILRENGPSDPSREDRDSG